MASHSEASARALAALLGAHLAFFCSVGFLNAFGVFQEYYHTHQLSHLSEFDISWLGSFAIGILFATSPLAGILVDKFGAQILVFCGSCGTLIGIFMTSLSHAYYQFFLAQALLSGVSMSFVFTPAVAITSKYFHRHRGLAMGITVGGSSVGGLIWPIVLDRLLNHHHVNFGWTLRIIGFIMLPLLLLCLLSLRSPPSRPSDELNNAPPPPQEKHKTDLSIARNPTFIILCSGLAICYLGMFSPFYYVISYARTLGTSTSLSFYMVSILNATSLLGRLLPGVLADRYGHFNLCALGALTSGITSLCWTAATTTAGLIVWCAAYGLTSGAIMSLQATCTAQIATHETHGTAVGLLMGSVALTALFGTPISGQLVGSYGYLALSLYSGASLVVGSLLIMWARLRVNRSLFSTT